MRGVWRLARLDPRWPQDFDLSVGGFWRSFAAPLVALPFYGAASVLLALAEPHGPDVVARTLLGAALARLADALGFPLLLALIADAVGFARGYPAFVVVGNWANLLLTLALFVLSPLTRLGADGVAAFAWASLIVLGLSIFLTARIARETLSRRITPVALVVVLALAWSVGADQLAEALLGAS